MGRRRSSEAVIASVTARRKREREIPYVCPKGKAILARKMPRIEEAVLCNESRPHVHCTCGVPQVIDIEGVETVEQALLRRGDCESCIKDEEGKVERLEKQRMRVKNKMERLGAIL